MYLSSSDIRHLTETLRVALSPLHYRTRQEWELDVLQSLKQLLRCEIAPVATVTYDRQRSATEDFAVGLFDVLTEFGEDNRDDLPVTKIPLRAGAVTNGAARARMRAGGRGSLREYTLLAMVLPAVTTGRRLLDWIDPSEGEIGTMPLRRAVSDIPPCAKLREVFGLTRREAEVARLLAAGASNKTVARVLGMRPATVRTHADHIFKKLGIHSRKGMSFALIPQPPTGTGSAFQMSVAYSRIARSEEK